MEMAKDLIPIHPVKVAVCFLPLPVKTCTYTFSNFHISLLSHDDDTDEFISILQSNHCDAGAILSPSVAPLLGFKCQGRLLG